MYDIDEMLCYVSMFMHHHATILTCEKYRLSFFVAFSGGKSSCLLYNILIHQVNQEDMWATLPM